MSGSTPRLGGNDGKHGAGLDVLLLAKLHLVDQRSRFGQFPKLKVNRRSHASDLVSDGCQLLAQIDRFEGGESCARVILHLELRACDGGLNIAPLEASLEFLERVLAPLFVLIGQSKESAEASRFLDIRDKPNPRTDCDERQHPGDGDRNDAPMSEREGEKPHDRPNGTHTKGDLPGIESKARRRFRGPATPGL